MWSLGHDGAVTGEATWRGGGGACVWQGEGTWGIVLHPACLEDAVGLQSMDEHMVWSLQKRRKQQEAVESESDKEELQGSVNTLPPYAADLCSDFRPGDSPGVWYTS